MSTNEDEKVDENVNIEISFIGEGGGRAILRFHRNDLTKTMIWRDAKIRVRFSQHVSFNKSSTPRYIRYEGVHPHEVRAHFSTRDNTVRDLFGTCFRV